MADKDSTVTNTATAAGDLSTASDVPLAQSTVVPPCAPIQSAPKYPPMLLVRRFYMDKLPPMSVFIRAFQGSSMFREARGSNYSPRGEVLYTCYGPNPDDIWLLAQHQELGSDHPVWCIFKRTTGEMPVRFVALLRLDEQFACDAEQDWMTEDQSTFSFKLEAFDLNALHKAKVVPAVDQ